MAHMDEPTSTENRGSTTRFWGLPTPRFGGHTLDEAATSYLTNVCLLFAFRLLAAGASLGITLTFEIPGIEQGRSHEIMNSDWLLILGGWNWFLFGVSFSLLTICSLQAGRKKSLLYVPNITVPLHQTAAAGIIFGSLIDFTPAWRVLQYGGQNTYGLFLIPFLLVFIDVLLGAKIQFRFAYLGFPVAVFAIWHLANRLYFGPLRWRDIPVSVAGYAAINIALVVWCFVAGVIWVTMVQAYHYSIRRLLAACARVPQDEARPTAE